MTKILVGDSLSKEGLAILEQEKTFEVDYKPDITPEELLKVIPDYEVLVVRSRTKVCKEVIDAAEKLRIIGRAGAGVDTIDVEAATDKGIIVMNTPGGNTVSTAELTLSMLMALLRNIPQAHQSMIEGRWDKKKYAGRELKKKTIGILGFGRVGREVATRLYNFGVKIIAYDPYVAPEIFTQNAVEKVELEEIFKRSDIITIHTPGGEDTKDLITKKEMAMMKDGVYIVNCARGGIVNVQDLIEALESGKVAGAAVDVYEKEPLDADDPFRKAPNIILTPHLGASTKEAQTSVAVQIAEQIIDSEKNNVVRSAVNAPSIEPDLLQQMRPYLSLAEKIGSFQSQFADARIKKIVVKYSGSVLNFPIEHLTTATIKGFMAHISDEQVNYINALKKAKEYGIKIEETKTSEEHPYTNLITAECQLENKKVNSISATLFTPTNPRFVIINDKHIDAYPEGHMIVIENRDVPGIIGNVGTLLGEHKINIAQMTWGRTDQNQEAMTVINVDQPVSSDILRKIGKLPNIRSARLIKL